jgi:hypothetical protein
MDGEFTRIELCRSDDLDTLDRVLAIFRDLGIVADDTWYDGPLGVGLTRFRRGTQEISIYRDAFTADLHGPAGTVQEVLAALASGEY